MARHSIDAELRLIEGLKANVENGCWEWTKATTNDGYGMIRIGTATVRTHRLAYSLFVRAINDGEYVLHSCNNRLCCNPSHLRAGNQSDNMKDKFRSGYSTHGINNPCAKYTWSVMLADGSIIKARCLSSFCYEHRLSQGAMHDTFTRKRVHHKGYRVVGRELAERS